MLDIDSLQYNQLLIDLDQHSIRDTNPAICCLPKLTAIEGYFMLLGHQICMENALKLISWRKGKILLQFAHFMSNLLRVFKNSPQNACAESRSIHVCETRRLNCIICIM